MAVTGTGHLRNLEVTEAIVGGVVSGTQQRARQGNWSMETVAVVVAGAVKYAGRRVRQEGS
jgi:hypothetical protein